VKHYNKMARQAGMTLIELTVVLLVLIGLAGLMIPYVGGFISKTHDSTGSDSLASLNSAIQRYDVQFMGQPSGYDSLMATNLTGGTVYGKMMGGTGTNDYLKTVTVAGKSLVDAGISSLMVMDDAAADATFAATASSGTVADGTDYLLAALSTKGSMCSMSMPMDAMGCIENDADLSAILGRSVNTSANDYIVFGVGQDSEMVGKTVSEAPVHFAKTGAMSANNKYNRILAVYQVAKTDTCIASNGQGFGAYWDTGIADTLVTITDEASCDAAAALATAQFVDDVATPTAGSGTGIGSATWSGSTAQKAVFLTTVMPMMKLEGLGGALASHYKSVGG